MCTNNILKYAPKNSKDCLKITDEYEYVNATKEMCKEIFGSREIPDGFDTWSVKEQCDWINKNLEKLYPNIPKSLLNFIPAYCSQLNYDRSFDEMPPWLDMDKYRRGQRFVQNNYAAIIICTVLGLLYVYTFEDALKPIILGRHSHTLHLGFKRYLSTLKHVMKWYDGEPWIKGTQAYNDVQFVRRLHLNMMRKLSKLTNEQIDAACKFANLRCPDYDLLRADSATFKTSGLCPYISINKSQYRPKGLNNADVAFTQGGFIILPILCPQSVGINDAIDEDLEAFCHMWRCYGYLLGLEDAYNFFRGSFEEIKLRMQDFMRYWAIPNLKNISPEWEHMSRCLVEPLNYYHPLLYVPYKTMILISTDGLKLNMPHLYASLSYGEWMIYKFYKFGLRYLLRFSIIRSVFNKLILRIVHGAMNFKADKMKELYEKSIKILPDFDIVY